MPQQATYTWDLSERLSANSSSLPAEVYKYDPFGRRVGVTSSGSSNWTLWLGDQLLATYDNAGARSSRRAYTDSVTAEAVSLGGSLSTESRLISQEDRIGASRLLVDPNGVAKWRSTYSAFGTGYVDNDPDADGISTRFDARFPGQEAGLNSALAY